MEIGEEDKPFVVEPLKDPVPAREKPPAPTREPVTPEREKVPA